VDALDLAGLVLELGAVGHAGHLLLEPFHRLVLDLEGGGLSWELVLEVLGLAELVLLVVVGEDAAFSGAEGDHPIVLLGEGGVEGVQELPLRLRVAHLKVLHDILYHGLRPRVLLLPLSGLAVSTVL